MSQVVERTPIHVEETSGIRRFFYPADARVPFAKGVLHDVARVRLLSDGTEVPATMTALDLWPDGSIQWLGVNFNVSLGPLGAVTFQVEYGSSVRRAASTRRGLTVTDDGDSVQVGRFRLGKGGDPLFRSITFGDETIGSGMNGLQVHDHDGEMFPIDVSSVAFNIVRQGAQYVEIEYTGRVSLGVGLDLPFEMVIGIPNSKSWFRASISVDDPEDLISGVSFETPLIVGVLPFVWDFGTDRWTYGSLQNATDAVRLSTPSTTDRSRDWEISTRRNEEWQVYEVSTEGAAIATWGHIQSERVVAFAMHDQRTDGVAHHIAIDGRGQLSMTANAPGAGHHELTVYHHYVSVPVQIGAATSPMSMLNPLITHCDEARYSESGVESPLSDR